MFCRMEPDDYYGEDIEWIGIDEHKEAIGDLQNVIERAKEELVKLRWAILSGDLKKISEQAEEIYGYLED